MSEYIISDEQIAENQRLKGRMLLVMPVVVRCRDCVHFSFEYGGICKRFLRTPFIFHTEYEGFCWRGERKEV